ncbi:hypothetical protein JTB14_032507 [Gonioctena quinquepunctata]|nr:hypothetical protein JTB14_032507 [Gonioctena quinquepunctata]
MDLKLQDSSVKNVVKVSLTGLTSINQEVALFDFGNVVVQKNYYGTTNVRIISGGAYCFGDLVGKGFLTAAAQGDNFMAPASRVILRTLRELSYNHIKGILLIVRASSGNLLNFGLATERALNDNLQVKLLAVSDDVYNERLPKIRSRGLSGIVLLTKIAGAMSEQDMSLTDIFEFCKKYLTNIVSTEMDLKEFTGSTMNTNNYMFSKSSEIVFGSGTKKMGISAKISEVVCLRAMNHLLNISPEDEASGIHEDKKLVVKPGDALVILLNNNGVISKTEEFIFAKEILDILSPSAIHVHRFYIGNFIKCPGKTDLTLTAMKVEDQEVLYHLDYPCSAPGWRSMNQNILGQLSTEDNILTGNLRRKDRLSPPIRGPKLRDALANILLYATQFACEALISCEKQLNIIDTERGDGDTGTRLKNASEMLLKRIKLDKIITNYPFTFFESLSKLLESSVGGTIGCIYSILLEAAARIFGEFPESTEITSFIWLESFESAEEALKRYGNIEFGDGTMYDPICAFNQMARSELEQGNNFIVSFGKAVEIGEETAQATKKNVFKYPDPGAHAVGIWMRAVYEGVKLRSPID